MDHPFKISTYLRQLAKRRKLILIPPLAALLVALALSALMPVRYTARTTLIAPKPQLVWEWDERVHDVVNLRFDWRAEVMPLVETQKVADAALEQVVGQLSQDYTPQEIMAATSVKAGTGSLFTISVKLANAKDAALIANALAQALPAAIADIYTGDQSSFAEAQTYAQNNYEALDEDWRAWRA